MKVLSQTGLSKLVTLIKSTFIKKADVIETETIDVYTKNETDLLLGDKQDVLTSDNAGANITIETDEETGILKISSTGSLSSVTWGGITGTLSNQTDLQNALNGKQDTITDLDTIITNASAGASAATTISGYGDIVTHNATDFLSSDTSIPTKTSDLNNDSGFITNAVNDLTNYTKTSDLADVATSGSYNDLSDTPTIPDEVTETTVSGWGFTKNEGTVTSVNNVSPVNGNVTIEIPTVPSDISSFNNDSGYITNSVNDLTNYTKTDDLSTVATSGSYNDLSDTPSIPTITDTYSSTSTDGMSGVAVASAISGKQDALPSGTTGYYLQKTATGVDWAEVTPGTDVEDFNEEEIQTLWDEIDG